MQTSKKYYCTFDPNTGERTGSYIQGLTDVPSGAISVSKADFDVYNMNPLARYDWNKKALTVVSSLKDKSIEDLITLATKKIDNQTATKIVSGVSVQLQGKQVVVSSDVYAQLYYLTCYVQSQTNPDATWDIHGFVAGMSTKTLFKVSADEIFSIYTACTEHIEKCKKEGWEKKDYVNSSERSIEELRNYVNNL